MSEENRSFQNDEVVDNQMNAQQNLDPEAAYKNLEEENQLI